jgi:phage terminase small subunit
LSKIDVQEEISRKRLELAAKTGLTQEWVLNRFKEISDRCMMAEPVLDSDGEQTGEFKFDSSGANKATEMIGKHLGFFELDNKKKVTVEPIIIDWSGHQG